MTVVEVAPTLRTAAGARAVLVVRVTAGATGAVRHVVRAVGLDPSWAGLPALTGPLVPGRTVDVELPVLVPAGSPSGSFPFVVSVTPDDGAAVEVDVLLVVGDAARLSLVLEPREPGGVRHRRFRVLLENGTADPVAVALRGQGPAEMLLRGPRRAVVVPPGGAARVRMSATVGRRLVGPARRLPFAVLADTSTGAARVDGTFVASPVLRGGAVKLLAVLAVLALWAGVSVVALGAVDRGAAPAQVVAGGASRPGDAGEGGADEGPSTGNGGTGNVAPGGGKDPVALTASGRLTGVVTGEDPGGVTVTLAPTSLPAEADQGARSGPARSFALRSRAATRIPSSQVLFPQARPLSRTLVTRTGADGAWAFAGVTRTGYYLLSFTKAGYQTKRFVLTRDGSAAPPMTTELTAGRGRASGRVLSEGRAVPGATVTVSDGSSTLTTSTGSTGDDVGRWSLSGLTTPGTYVVAASAPGRALASRLVTLGAGRNGTGVDLVLKRGLQTVVGEVRQAGDALGGVTVTAVSGETTRTATSLSTASAGDLAGAYSLPDLPLGDHVVTWSAPGYTSVTRKAVLTGASPSLRLPDVVLQTSGASLSGVVTDTSDEPLVGAGLALASLTTTYKITSADDGSYRFDGIEPGSYVLTVEKFGHRPAVTPVDVAAGRLRVLDLRLRPVEAGARTGTITGEVADARTTGLIPCPGRTACITVEVLDAVPPVAPVQSDGARPYVVPGPGAPGLDAGQYRVRVSAPGYDSAVVPVAVPLDGVGRAARVALQPRGAVVGTITPGAAAPLPPTCVVVAPSVSDERRPTPPCTLGVPDAAGDPTCTSTEGSACGVVGPRGEYRVAGLPRPGGYVVHVVPVGPAAQEWAPVPGAQIVLEPGETERYDAELSRRARLQLLLRAPSPSGGLQTPSEPVEVVLTALDGGPAPPRPSYTAAPGQDGLLLVTGLESGSYAVQASGTPLGGTTQYSGRLARVSVGTNQTTRAELVLSRARPSVFVGRVQWSQDGTAIGVPGAAVTVTGTTGYTGTTPVGESKVARTNAAGCYAVTRDGTTADLVDDAAVPAACGTLEAANVAALALTVPEVTVKADATGVATERGRPVFGTVTDDAVAGTGLVVSQVSVAPVPFTGRVTSVPEPPAPRPFARTRVVLTSAAPGAGVVAISSDADGVLTWRDPTTGGPGLVRPGTYALLAQLEGFDDAVGTLTCTRTAQGGAAPCTVTLTLPGDVTLVVTVRTSASATVTPVPGAEVTLTAPGVPTTTVPVPRGTATVSFPGLGVSDGPYTVTARALGFVDARSAPLDLAKETDRSVTLVQERLGSFQGRVRARIGQATTPLAGVRVTATPRRTNGEPPPGEVLRPYSAVTEADGSYRITGSLAQQGLPFDSGITWSLEADVPDGFTGDPRPGSFPPAARDDESLRVQQVDLLYVADGVDLVVTVKDDRAPGGVLVADATVVVQPTDGSEPRTLQGAPDRSGTYRANGLAPVGYVLTVTAPDRALLTTALTLSPGRAVTTVEVLVADLRNSIRVQVTGRGSGGRPQVLTGARVSVRSARVTPREPVVATPSPTADPTDEPTTGPTSDSTDGPTDGPTSASTGDPSTDPTTGPEPDPTETSGDPTSSPSPVYRPVRDPTPACPDPPLTPTPPQVDETGAHQEAGLLDDLYDVVVVGPDGWTCAYQRVEVRRGQLATLDVTLYQLLPDVDVRVVSSTGDSVDGAQVSLLAEPGTGTSQGPQVASGSSTASSLFTQVVPGTYLLTTRGPDLHLASTRTVTVEMPAAFPATQPLDAVIEEDRIGVRVAGGSGRADVTVSSAAGPVVTVSVNAARRDVYVPRCARWDVRVTAPDETVLVTDESQQRPGSASADPSPQPSPSPTPCATSASAPTPPSDRRSGSGSRDLLVALGAPVPPAEPGSLVVTVEGRRDTSRAAEVTVSGPSGSVTRSTGPDGTVTFPRLEAGTYDVVATTVDGGFDRRSAPVTAGSPASTTTLQLTYGTGTLQVDVRGVPAPDASTTVTVSGGPPGTTPRTAQTGVPGQVLFGGLEPGRYDVRVTSPSGAGRADDVAVAAGGTTQVTVTVVVEPVVTPTPDSGTVTTGG